MNPPPQPPVCLTRSYTSRSIKGGTVIAEDVLDADTHRQRMLDPDEYRRVVGPCRQCEANVHAHCFRDRLPRSLDPAVAVEAIAIRLYRCAKRSCGAVFTVLPGFIARHLWRRWSTVEDGTRTRTGPRSTLGRWLLRLDSDAEQLVQFIASLGDEQVRTVVLRTRPSDRSGFVTTLTPILEQGHVFARIAAFIHRLVPGIRLM